MFYFIPSWYNEDRPWYDNTALWFRVFERMTFDDIINQVKMFENAHEPSQLILLNYQPQLRYFLHKQDLLGAHYWSFFDDIQNISKRTTNPISFKELNWPQGTHFLYSPFAVVARQGTKVIAVIHFAENGNLFYIDFQKDDQIEKRYMFDDRGFLSSILYHDKNGKPHHQDYLNENGVWQVREYFDETDLKLEINPSADKAFEFRYYMGWENLIAERLDSFKTEKITSEDTIVVASHHQHNNLLLRNFLKQKKVFSFFANRTDLRDEKALATILHSSTLLVTGTEKDELVLQETLKRVDLPDKKLTRISPFDTRLRLGHSQMVRELMIYLYIDGLSEQELETVLYMILEMMEEVPDIELAIVTFDHTFAIKEWEEWLMDKILHHFDPTHFLKVVDLAGENQLDEDIEMEMSRISLSCYTNENQIIEALDRARLVVDLGQTPDLYTQIASISAGVPQINRVKTDYVNHLKNGWVLDDIMQLPEAVHYYFDGLANWNASLVYAVQKMADYTSGRILKQWKELLEKD